MKKILRVLSVSIMILGISGSALYAEDIPAGQSEIVPAETLPAGQSDSIPAGQTEAGAQEGQGVTSDIFGQEGGILHPYIIVQEKWTDNLFTTQSDEKSDFVTTIAPGIWLAFPANREKLLSLDTTTSASGGMKLSRIKPEALRRFQTYFLYSPEVELYADHSDQDHFNHNAQGLFQYNLNNGLSFDIIDIFKDREDISDDGTSDTLYRYSSNLADFITTYDPSEKLTLRFDYSNYYLDYNEDVNDYRNRMDNGFDFYLFYKFTPKTSVFAQYAYTLIDYDDNDDYDNTENKYFAGINWAMTTKSRGGFKVGYMEKSFDGAGIDTEDGLSFELQAQHNFSAKRAIQANAYRMFNESDMESASGYYNTGIDVGLTQKFTEKISATLNMTYEKHEYNQSDREDDYIRLGPAMRWTPREWGFFDLAYYWTNKDSNENYYDYTSNMVILKFTATL